MLYNIKTINIIDDRLKTIVYLTFQFVFKSVFTLNWMIEYLVSEWNVRMGTTVNVRTFYFLFFSDRSFYNTYSSMEW